MANDEAFWRSEADKAKTKESALLAFGAYIGTRLATEPLLAALRKLVFAARTSGGVAGRDESLCAACDEAEALLTGYPRMSGCCRGLSAQDCMRLYPDDCGTRYDEPKSESWYCDQCHVEVYQLRCQHCGKSKREAK